MLRPIFILIVFLLSEVIYAETELSDEEIEQYTDHVFNELPKRVAIAIENNYRKSLEQVGEFNVYYFQGKISEASTDTAFEFIISKPDEYLLVPRAKLNKENQLAFTYFQVFKFIDTDRYELLFASSKSWRIFDFKRYEWSGKNINVITGDIGLETYYENGGKWLK